jgi:Domain of unknown function (DUF4326)
MTPKRVQRKRTKGWRMPPNTVSVTRRGNPFAVTEFGREVAIEKYPEWLAGKDLSELRGKNLACYCALDEPCHADVLLELANAAA